uniref:Lipoxygenase domain-containing protein n=1 Tax=Zooxanthella nutricula TaxID=1333877 RepID=A0A7S2M8G6_9DINO
MARLGPDEGDEEQGPRSWPAAQPEPSRKARYFACGRQFVLLVPLVGGLAYMLGFAVLLVVAALALVVFCLLGFPLCSLYAYQRFWECGPWRWQVDLYVKATYLAYQSILLSRTQPDAGPKCMPIELIGPKRKLTKYVLDYALNIKVPKGTEEEFLESDLLPTAISQFFEERLSLWPQTDKFDNFTEREDPVAYVMAQVGNIYPEIYQDWTDKRSDVALTRLCLHGIGAHRVETVSEGGARFFVVRTNQLSNLPVRDGFARYGGDAYFDMDWRPVKIVDQGDGPFMDDGSGVAAVFCPGDARWEEAKFRFRSSLSVLVTLVDHLYGVHLQLSNIMVTAVREQLSADHPMRRFLCPFTYQTISVNDNARNNLVQPRSMGPRCFAFTEQGMTMAFSAAPGLLMSGMEVPASEGGPILNRERYTEYLREKRGIDTEYWRQSLSFWRVCRRFVADYMLYYYPTRAAAVFEPDLRAMFQQFQFQLELTLPILIEAEESENRARDAEGSSDAGNAVNSPLVDKAYEHMLDIFADFIMLVTAGHEQVGAVEAYVQDVSFCAFKWTPGALAGTKQTATAQALLMSFTSTPMPKLMGDDWTHLFPPLDRPPPAGAKTPQQSFKDYQDALKVMSTDCDAYNAATPTRTFPECFPLYVMNPKNMETSISV